MIQKMTSGELKNLDYKLYICNKKSSLDVIETTFRIKI